jgi:hypothetical protein
MLLRVPLISPVYLLCWHLYNSVHVEFIEQLLDSIMLQEVHWQETIHLSDQWDLPFITLYALSFGMFKTYAVVH